MVVSTHDHCFVINWNISGFRWQQCNRPIYLYIILVMKDRKTQIETLSTISMGFLVIYLIWDWKPAIPVALALGLIGLFSPFLSRYISWVWMKLAEILGMIMPKVILGILFYLVLFPISLLSKLSIKDRLKMSRKYPSYYADREFTFDRKSFEHPW